MVTIYNILEDFVNSLYGIFTLSLQYCYKKEVELTKTGK